MSMQPDLLSGHTTGSIFQSSWKVIETKLLQIGNMFSIQDISVMKEWVGKCEGFPGGTSGKEHTCQFLKDRLNTLGFDLWVGKISWRRAWQSTPVFLLRESPWTEKPGRLQSLGSERVRHD